MGSGRVVARLQGSDLVGEKWAQSQPELIVANDE